LRVLWLIACLGLAAGQEDDNAAAAATGEAAAADEAECEESWEYIEFLREITTKLETTFVEIRDVQNRVGSNALVDSVSQTLTQVLGIRESVLDRIFRLRKREITTCPNQDIKQEAGLANLSLEIMDMLVKLTKKDASANDKLKQIRDDLLAFKTSVTSESLRIMMLPQVGGPQTPEPTGDCSECDTLERVEMKITDLINCAKGQDTQEEPASDEAADADDTAAPGGNANGGCMPPAMYIMEVMEANRLIDTETETLLPTLVSTVDEAERSAIEKKFNDLKQVREKLEASVRQFSSTKPDDEDKIRRIAKNMEPISKDINQLLKDCQSNCDVPPTDDCESCGADELTKMLSKMDDYKRIYNNSEENPIILNGEVRKDLMKFISTNTAATNELLQKKIQEGNLDACDEQKLMVFNKTKGPMWMLVNTTIFTEGTEEPTIMLGAMEEMMKALKEEYCTPGPTTRPTIPTGDSCEWAEYEKTGEYLNRIDTLIQDHLFKPTGENSKVEAQLGFLELRREFDTRVQQLFKDGMVCPEEVVKIKKDWMSSATKCMSLFMNSKLKFKEMSRLQRIQCTKNLKIQMEDRRSELLSKELENSIKKFEGGSAPEDGGPQGV